MTTTFHFAPSQPARQRRSALVAAQRLVEQRAIDVSLYYRAPEGTPVRPGSDRLPPLPAGLPTSVLGEDDEVRTALERRPDVAARQLRRDQQQVDLRLAENTLLPSLDFFSEVTTVPPRTC
jgi:outer membrane protein, heavy metal efflux system